MKKDITFSGHALSQFCKRLCIPMINGATKIRQIWYYTKEITREQAWELTYDKEILKKKNKFTKYYLVNFNNPEIYSYIKTEKNTGLPINEMYGIFIVKENYCVTFKTTYDNDIWQHLIKHKNSIRNSSII